MCWGAGDDDLPQNLLARLLRDGFDRVLRRGLDRGYREHAEETRRPRGKVDLPATARRALRARGRVRVRYEELSCDVLHKPYRQDNHAAPGGCPGTGRQPEK